MADQGEDAAQIAICGDLREFFGSLVEHVRRCEHYEASAAAEMYVVALLADASAGGTASPETLSQPLTTLFDAALSLGGRERFERLRSLGDGVLYVTGFFRDYLSIRGLELDYYSELGAQAYDVAGRMLERRGRSPTCRASDEIGASAVLGELSVKFPMFVSLVHHVADALYAGSVRSDRGALEVYERWLRTGSSTLAQALAEQGLLPCRGNGTVH